ncbi:uncharacterized protein A4U43_C03F5050 [Asparagus officinalis]|uniref:N-acetyltransferase domain-containing protein n=1 Tax=Asparagus officinalis TaxID=4686 RepID=A0A5P1F812_ASPOF|nr:uncharacterized protein A4U43_C03F5050 [Asparagus officinalis]
MTSVERKRDLENKRGASRSLSKRRVLESKEKKKRRLILYDSDSDDDEFVVSPRIKTLEADNVDEVKEATKSDLGLEVGKQAEEGFLGSGVRENGGSLVIKEKSSIDGFANNEEAKLEPKSEEREEHNVNESTNEEKKGELNKGLSSDVFEKMEEDVGEKVKNASAIKEKNSIELLPSETDGNASPIKESCTIDQVTSKEDIQVQPETILRSEVVKWEDADEAKKVTDVSAASQNGKCSMVKKKSSINRSNSEQERNIDSEKRTKSKVVKEREETGSKKKLFAFHRADQNGSGSVTRKKSSINQSCSREEIKVEEKKVFRSKFIKEREEARSRKKSNGDHLTSEKEERLERKKILKLEVHKEREGADSARKKSSESSSERKRSRETLDDKISSKKFRSGDVKHRVELEPGDENIKRKNPVAYDDRQRALANEKRMQEDLEKNFEPEAENCRWIERSTARTLRKLKANSSSGDTRIDDVDVSQQKGLGQHGKGSVLRVLPSNKKVGGIEGGHIRREAKEERKNILNHSLLSIERKNEKPISTTKSVKGQLNSGKASAMIKMSTKDEANERRGTVKQRIREQIKGILLDAGWTIDLRPRKGRCYEDAVYVPPTGGAGFWSITKAYDVYVKSCSKKSSQGDQGCKGSTFATIPAELLQMLTRNVVNKRRSREEIEMGERLVARTKGKGNLRIKSSKNNVDGCKARKKRGCALLVRGSNQVGLHIMQLTSTSFVSSFLQMLPPGVWHCANCTCRYCGLVSGAVSKEDGSDAYMLLTCSQCERKYHRECIPEEDFVSVHSNDSDTSFCGKTCRKILWQLHKLLGKKNDLEAGLSWRLIRCLGEDSSRYPCNLPQKTECNSKIVVAFAVMDECFRPIIDQRSGINLVHNVVYNCGSNINRLSYTGFYTFVLEREDEIISVASVRIHGAKLAEMPFIGTRNMYRRQGMCRKLLKGIESALYSLNVEILIIPAIAELMETWTSNFGFEPLELLHRKEVSSTNTLIFPGTGLLYKPIVKKGSTEEHTTSDGGELGESATDNGHVSEAPNKHEEEGAGLVLEKTENSDASSKSQSQTPAFESLASATDVDLSTHPKLDQNDITCEDTLGVHSPKEPKIEIPRVGTLHGNQESTNPVFIAMSDQSAGAAKHDTNVKTSYYSADNSTQHLTSPEVDDGALSVNSESNISSACGIKSYVMPPDTHNHRQHIISKDSALVVNGDSACSEIVTASHVHSSIVKSPKLSYAEDSNGGVDSSVCKSGTPGGALNCCLT